MSDLHRALITDPMAIERDVTDSPKSSDGARKGFAAEMLLGLAGTVCFVIIGCALIVGGQETFGFSMLALALWLPALLAQDYWRWIGFMSRNPRRSLANDTVFNCVQAAAFVVAIFVLGWKSEPVLVAAWGLGGLAGAAYGLWQYRVFPSIRGGLSLLRARWSVSKWIASGIMTAWASSQMYVFLVGALLGPVGLGSVKAAQTLVTGPSMVLIQAGGSIGLPEASRAHAEKGWSGLARVTRVVGAAGLLSFLGGLAVVVLFGRFLLSHVYGPSFAHFEGTAILFGIANVFVGFNLGPVLVLKATRRTRLMFQIQVLGLLITIIGMVILCAFFGVPGAAEATIVTCVIGAFVYRLAQHRVRREVTQEKTPTPSVPISA
jgi:O-antigen/teichoic acid export membrane protein